MPNAAFFTGERSTRTKARLAYFYCDANTSETLGTEAILGSLLGQLCASKIPSAVEQEYRKAREAAIALPPPTLKSLRGMLVDAIKLEGDVIFVVDGIDEAIEFELLCEFLLSRPSTRFQAIS